MGHMGAENRYPRYPGYQTIYMMVRQILQGLRVAQAAVTERWPLKAEKRPKKTPFFLKKIKFTTQNFFFLHLSSSYAKIWRGKINHICKIHRSG